MPATTARMYKNVDKMTSSDARISVPVPSQPLHKYLKEGPAYVYSILQDELRRGKL